MVKEIGSEFWDVPAIEYENGLFQDSCQWFLSGRSALRSIIMELDGCSSVSLPSWCCDSMIKPFVDAGIHVSFYPVYWDKGLIQEPNTDCDAILCMDYFGYSGTFQLPDNYKGLVIRDITHSLFSNKYDDANFYFASLRKWCGLWTGGFAWTKDGKNTYVKTSSKDYVELRKKAMLEKRDYIANGTTVGNNKEYLKLFGQAEELLDLMGAEGAEERDIYLAKRLDVKTIRTKRCSNATVLLEAFKDWLVFPELKEHDCPMFVPILVPNGKRNELRQYLIDNEIYCPVHWPVSSYHVLDDRERFIYDNELSLVCDQRYDENDMLRIIEAINVFWKDAE